MFAAFAHKHHTHTYLQNINARKALVQAEETSQELVIAEAEHAKAKLESSRWRPIGAPASADGSDNDDPQLAELRARAIASLEVSDHLFPRAHMVIRCRKPNDWSPKAI